MKTLITSGTLILPSKFEQKDILIEDGIITRIGNNLDKPEGTKIVDAKDIYVLPGAIDVHTHFELAVMNTVSSDDFFTGTRAAAAGGTTTIIDFVHPKRGQDYQEALQQTRDVADPKVVIDYGLHLAVTWFDPQKSPKMLRQVVESGVTSLKIYLAYCASVGVQDSDLFKILEVAKELKTLVMAHAEDDTLAALSTERIKNQGITEPYGHALARPPAVEMLGTAKFLAHAAVLDLPVYIVHLSCSDAFAAVHRARSKGQSVAVETCPQYLLLYDIIYKKLGWEAAKWIMTPPLRTHHDNDLLFQALKHRQIQTIGTDHCPFNFNGQKDMNGKSDFTGIPGGIPGVQDRLELMYSYGVDKRKINICQWVELCCQNPAKLFGLYPQKGTIAVGSDADIVLFDPERQWAITAKERLHNVDYSAYEGFSMQGKVIKVFSRGDLVHDEDRVDGKTTSNKAGRGKFLKRGQGTLFEETEF